jgi:2-(1,2-epoxy-1,2-dihydrophenyl)acetyl-CoA isomerase
MDYKTIILGKDTQTGIATITLNRPDKLNAFSPLVSREFSNAVWEVYQDNDVKVLVINGSGRAFCAGGDIVEDLTHSAASSMLWKYDHDWRFINTVPVLLRYMAPPSIASVHGHCIGIGTTLPLACDFIIAADTAKFSLGFIRVGITPEFGSTYNLPRLVGMRRAMELATTGRTFDAEEALRIGIVNKVVPEAQLKEATRDFALSLAQGPSIAIELTKRALYNAWDGDIHAALQFEAFAQETAHRTDDGAEGPRAFAEKRKPKFKGR